MSKCVKCGNEIKANEKFCTKCGTPAVQDKTVGSVKRNTATQNISADIVISEQKYKLIKYKQGISILMIISTSIAIIVGLIAVFSMVNNLSYAHGLSHEGEMIYTIACILSGLYQTILCLALLVWIYILKKSLIQKNIFEATGRIE